MKSEQFLQALGCVDDTLLDICDTYTPTRHHPWKWVSAAACIAVAALSAVFALHRTQQPPQVISGAGDKEIAVTLEQVPDSTVVTVPATAPSDGTASTAAPQTQPFNPAFTPNETVGDESPIAPNPYSGTANGFMGETAVESCESLERLFANAPTDATRYPTLPYGGQNYTSRGRSKPVTEGGILQRVTLTGFDNVHKTEAEVYKLRGISPKAAVAVYFPQTDKMYTYVNPGYDPDTLGALMDDLALDKTMVYGKVHFEKTVYAAPAAAQIDKLFVRSAARDRAEVRRQDAVYVDVDIPILGYSDAMLGVTKDGYLVVNLLETVLYFDIGQARTDAFLRYLSENCSTTTLGADTTAPAVTTAPPTVAVDGTVTVVTSAPRIIVCE